VSDSITHLVFDLGGVIVELNGTPVLEKWIAGKQSSEQIWKKWLTSDDSQTFAGGVVRELNLDVSEEEFLAHFTALPIGPYPGALTLLASLKQKYTTALFSNSNELHWERKMGEMQLKNAFHHHFASHLMGKVKPDADAFAQVLDTLAVPARQVLFFDDNQLNVDAAQQSGMRAVRVNGFSELTSVLAHFDINVS